MQYSFDHNTQQLVTLAKAGDNGAFDQLCRVYGERVRRIARLRMGRDLRCKFDSMDLVQDALFSALGGLSEFTYKNEGDFLRWLARIAENQLRDNVDRLHANKRDIRKEVRVDNNGPVGESMCGGFVGGIDTATPSMIMSKKEDLDRLEKALDELKPDHREVIVLTKIEGLSYKDIGQRLGKSVDAVGMLLSRAMVALTIAYGRI